MDQVTAARHLLAVSVLAETHPDLRELADAMRDLGHTVIGHSSSKLLALEEVAHAVEAAAKAGFDVRQVARLAKREAYSEHCRAEHAMRGIESLQVEFAAAP